MRPAPRRPRPPHRLQRPRQWRPNVFCVSCSSRASPSVCAAPFALSLAPETPVQAVFPRTLTKPVHTANLRAVDLARRTLELIDIASPSRGEAALLEHVAGVVPIQLVYGTDEALLYSTERTEAPLVLLAGHLDTVPAQNN